MKINIFCHTSTHTHNPSNTSTPIKNTNDTTPHPKHRKYHFPPPTIAPVTNWFTDITSKNNTAFIQFDITDFYPSITEYTLDRALELATQHVLVSQYEVRIIKHCRKFLLFHDSKPWIKKLNNHLFDVTMGSFDGAKVCELVGALILAQLSNIIKNTDMGLYRDDGIIIIRNPNEPKLDSFRKRISNALKLLGFKINIHTNLKIGNFLDVTRNFSKGTFEPYKGENDTPIYIHTSSNYPPSVIK